MTTEKLRGKKNGTQRDLKNQKTYDVSLGKNNVKMEIKLEINKDLEQVGNKVEI